MKKKIEKFFKDNGFTYKYYGSKMMNNIGGRGWNNDGYYTEDVYELRINGKKFSFRDKTSGRARFWLQESIENGKYAIGFSQKDFIEEVQRLIDREEI